MRYRRAAGVLVVLWAARGSAAPPPEARPDLTPTARELSDQGLRQYQKGEYDAAIESFMGAFAMSNNNGLLFNVAQAYRLKRDCDHAKEYYQRYLDAAPETALKASVEKRVEEMEACVAEKRANTKANTTATARATGARPSLDAGGPRQVTARMQPPPAPSWRRPAVIATAAGALVCSGAGILFALRSRSAEQDLSQQYAGGGAWDDAAQQRYEAGKRDRVLSIASFATAGAAAAVATWLGVRSGARPATVTLAPRDNSRGLAIAAGWRF